MMHSSILFLVFCLFILVISGHDNEIPPCETGYYRSTPGLRECTQCPRGRYGSSTDLISAGCTGPCPIGRYNDILGAKSVDDCNFCPAGTYGASAGQKTATCTSKCPKGKYSTVPGQTRELSCLNCPNGYYQWQCAYKGNRIVARGE